MADSEMINPSRKPPAASGPIRSSPPSPPEANSVRVAFSALSKYSFQAALAGVMFLAIGEWNQYKWRFIENEVLKNTIDLPPNAKPSDVQDGSTVHYSGRVIASPSSPLKDTFFDARFHVQTEAGAILLRRQVERYQRICDSKRCEVRWGTEERHNDQIWSKEGPHSQSIAPAVTRIGNFVLDRSLIERSSFSKKFPIPTAIQLEFREKPFRRILGNGKEERWTYDGDYFYSGDPHTPKGGDYRISFTFVPGGMEASVLGKYNAKEGKLSPSDTIYKGETIAAFGPKTDLTTSVKRVTGPFMVNLNLFRMFGVGLLTLGFTELALETSKKTKLGASIVASAMLFPRIFFLFNFGRVLLPFGGSIAIFSRESKSSTTSSQKSP